MWEIRILAYWEPSYFMPMKFLTVNTWGCMYLYTVWEKSKRVLNFKSSFIPWEKRASTTQAARLQSTLSQLAWVTGTSKPSVFTEVLRCAPRACPMRVPCITNAALFGLERIKYELSPQLNVKDSLCDCKHIVGVLILNLRVVSLALFVCGCN